MPTQLAPPPNSLLPERPALRLVLDTSTLIAGIRWVNSKYWWLRDAWHNRLIIPLTSNETETEFRRTLRKPDLHIPSESIRDIERDYLDYCDNQAIEEPLMHVPTCRYPKDQPFLYLAYYAEANYPVTGDDDLLTLRDLSLVPIIKPERLRSMLLQRL